MAFLTKEQILTSNDTNDFIEVDVPEWGGTLNIKRMSGAQRDRIDGIIAKDPYNNLRAKVVAFCACDEKGNLLFTNEAEVQQLGQRSNSALERVFKAALEHSAYTEQAKDEVAKN